MGRVRIPQKETKDIIKPNKGDVFGNLLVTKNIDLESNPGRIKLSETLYSVFDDDDDADFDLPVQMVRTNASQTDQWWLLSQRGGYITTDGLMWKAIGTDPGPNGNWAQDAIANSPTDAVDNMVIFGQASSYDRLIVARATNLTMLNNGTWTASWWQGTLGQSALGSNPHYIKVFSNFLMVPDGNVIHVIDDSLVVTLNRIILPKEYKIIWIEDDGIQVYIGTQHTRNGNAYVFPWDGTSASKSTYGTPLSVYDRISMAGVAKDGIMHTINSKGQLLANNGAAFQEVARLPVANTSRTWDNEATTVIKMIHPNGMKVIDGDIHILLNGMIEKIVGRVLTDMPSGIWIYNQHGLRQKYSLGMRDLSFLDAWGASAVDSVGVLVETGKDYGRFIAGAVIYENNTPTPRATMMSSRTNNTTNQRGYFISSIVGGSEARAMWTRLTTLFKSFENSTDRIIIKYRVTKKQAFEIETLSTQFFSITWDGTDLTKFTLNDSDFSNVSVGDEIEIMNGKGEGATAHVATIVNTSASNYTVTLDESIPSSAGTALARFQNWKKISVVSTQNITKKDQIIGKRSNWIQFKVELRGTTTSPELEELQQLFQDSIR